MGTLIKTRVREEEPINFPSEATLDFLHGWLKTGGVLTRNEKCFSHQQHYEQRHSGEEYMACTEMSVLFGCILRGGWWGMILKIQAGEC